MDLKEIGARAHFLRDKHGLTQESVAEQLGLSRASVSNIERGEQNMTVECLMKLCDGFKMSLVEFLIMEVPEIYRKKKIDGCLHNVPDFHVCSICKMIQWPKKDPIPMVMFCPAGHQHVDEGEWATKVHRTHQCQKKVFVCNLGHDDCNDGKFEICGLEWRPSNEPTMGVKEL